MQRGSRTGDGVGNLVVSLGQGFFDGVRSARGLVLSGASRFLSTAMGVSSNLASGAVRRTGGALSAREVHVLPEKGEK